METIEFPFMVLLRNAPAGMFAYAPKAPSVKIQKSEYGILLEELALAVQPWLPPQVICIRFDTLWKSPYGNALTAVIQILWQVMDFSGKQCLRQSATAVQAMTLWVFLQMESLPTL